MLGTRRTGFLTLPVEGLNLQWCNVFLRDILIGERAPSFAARIPASTATSTAATQTTPFTGRWLWAFAAAQGAKTRTTSKPQAGWACRRWRVESAGCFFFFLLEHLLLARSKA